MGDFNVLYGEKRKGDIEHSLADISMGRELLGYEARVNFEEGLRRTIMKFGLKIKK